jgi:hypothetical protein
MKLADIDILSIGNTVQLAGAVYVGDGKAYLVMLPDEHVDVLYSEGGARQPPGSPSLPSGVYARSGGDALPLEVLNLDPDEWKQFLVQTDIMETEILEQAGPNEPVVKAIARKSQRQIDQNVQWAVWRRDGCRCRYCGRNDCPMTVDHLVLWEEGGPTIEENLATACRKCNKTRGRIQYSAWLAHPYYKKVSAGLAQEVLDLNRRVLETLDSMPRRVHVHSR